jgi:hypothetical protein
MHLSDQEIEAIRSRVGKVAIVEYNGHQIVFRRPTRDEMHGHRARQDDPREKPGSLDLLAQVLLAAFDGETDTAKARPAFSGFLDEHPAFTSNQDKFLPAVAILCGMVEDEVAKALGKGVSVRSSPPPSTPTA